MDSNGRRTSIGPSVVIVIAAFLLVALATSGGRALGGARPTHPAGTKSAAPSHQVPSSVTTASSTTLGRNAALTPVLHPSSRSSTTSTTAPLPGATAPTTTAPAPSAPLAAGDIVYDGGIGGARFEVFAMHPDGTEVRQLTDDARYNSWWARPSPDRTRILFYRTPAGVPPTTYGRAELWMMSADGSNAHVVLPQGTNGWTFQAHGEWSPDGTRIVFTAATTQALIMTTAADGSDLRVLGGGPGANVDPSFSPDGRSIVYIGCPSWACNPATTEVFVMPADGAGSRTRLTFDAIRDQDPVVSPAGDRIAFLSATAPPGSTAPYGLWNLRTVGIDGTDVRQITSGSALESAPRWSPDGARIWTHRTAFDAYAWDLTSMRVDGSDLRPINMPNAQEFPALA